MPIRQLAPDVAAKIAAGEVVERPASVVKELIENSIDAGATHIRVELMNGGLQLIRVTDNGSGIPAEELPLALSRHATSKVTHIDDLEKIRSLGFRGEALASIAAVADVTLLTRHKGANQGAQVSAQNGVSGNVNTAASPEGTSLTIRNLFSSVPARLKFLKSRNTEVSHCLHLLEQYALAYPGIRFSVSSEGRQLFSTPGDGQLTSVLIEIYGLAIAEQMVPISSLDGKDDDPERPVASGHTSVPACYKSTRQHMSFFVNHRWVHSRMLSYAVEEAYHSLLLPGRHPISVVNISVDPSQIDVNVHPAKTEIRFLKERRVYSAILRAIRSAVLAEATVPTWSGKHAQIVQVAATENVASEVSAEPASEAETFIQESALLPQDSPWLTATEEETGTRPPSLSRLWQGHVRPKDHATGLVSKNKHSTFRPSLEEEEDDNTPTAVLLSQPPRPAMRHEADVFPEPEKLSVASAIEAKGPPLGEVQPLVQQQLADTQDSLPALRVIGQFAQSYIITEGQDGLYLIDQHAAHERILLERMVAALQTRAPLSQLLLTPILLKLSPVELSAIEERHAQLAHIGFDLTIENTTVAVKAVPQVLMKQINARSLQELLTELTAPESPGHAETWEEHALANVACKAAIKANYFLTSSEMREMLNQLALTKAPYSCCHGRPTTVRFSLSALEHEFGRR